VKKLFLVFLVMLAGMAGLSAAPPGEGGSDGTPQAVMFQEGSAAFITAPGVRMPQLSDGVFAMALDNKAAFIQYQERFLTVNDFKPLGMRALAEKTRQRADRLFMYRELQLGIHGPASLVPVAGTAWITWRLCN
jgi:hypothetical protein